MTQILRTESPSHHRTSVIDAPETNIRDFVGKFCRCEVKKGQEMVMEGDECSHAYFVERGALMNYRINKSGDQNALGVLTPNDLLHLPLETDRWNSNVRAVLDGIVRKIPSDVLRHEAESSHSFLRLLLNNALRIATRDQNLSAAMRNNALSKVAAFIYLFSEERHNGTYFPPYNGATVSTMTGVTEETVSRMRTTLHEAGIVLAPGKGSRKQTMQVLNPERLKKIVDGGEL